MTTLDMTSLDLNLYDKVDENENLELYHFNYETEYEYPNLKLKGLVVDKDNKQVVCSTSLHTLEYDIDNASSVPGIDNITWPDARVYISHEGCFLRVFQHNDKWYVTTHRKLDANDSRWGTKHSFKTLFIFALITIYGDDFDIDEDFFSKLNPDNVYTFLLRNDQFNRIVSDYPSQNEPKIYFTGYFPKGLEHDYLPQFDDVLPEISRVEEVKVVDFDELNTFVKNQSYKHHQGVLVFTKDQDGITHIFKLMCPKYLSYKEVRNNCSNLLYRYSQLRLNPSQREKLVELFPYLSLEFFQFENSLQKISSYISSQYINRFVKKQYAAVTPLQYKITKKLYDWYLLNPGKNYINPRVVLDFINEESPMYVYKLVMEYYEQKPVAEY